MEQIQLNENMDVKLKELLDEEGLEDVQQALKELEDQKKKLKELESKSKGKTKVANDCISKIKRLEEILKLDAEVKKMSSQEWVLVDSSSSVSPALTATTVNLTPTITILSAISPTVPELADVMQSPARARSLSITEQENIQECFTDASKKMPACAERTLIRLFSHFQLLEKKSITTPLLTEEELVNEFQLFKKQLAIEHLENIVVSESVERLEQHFKNADSKLLAGEFRRIIKELRPLDIELLIKYIQKTHEAAIKIKGKKIVLLLGPTGSGKSTTIHFLAGSKMRKTIMHGLRHIDVIDPPSSELSEVTTSPFTRSETRSIAAVTVPYSRVGAKTEGEVVLCDSPGFGDTDGTEIDIANGIGIVKAVRECLSVKPVILISQQSIGDRWEGITRLAQTLMMFISSIDKRLKTFSYIFTKFHEDYAEEIHAKLENKLKCLNADEKNDQAFVALLKDIANKTNSGCSILVTQEPPNKFTLASLQINTEAAYVKTENEIYYINKKNGDCLKINVKPEILNKLNKYLKLDSSVQATVARILTNTEINYIEELTQQPKHQIIWTNAKILDPLKDKPGQLLDELAETPAIETPAEAFRDFVTPGSLEKLKEQLNRHQSSVMKALSRFDFGLLNYKLEQLHVISQQLNVTQSEKIYRDCITEIVRVIEKDQHEAFDRMAICLQDGNAAIEADLKLCSKSMLNLMRLENIRKNHFSSQLLDLDDACKTCLIGAQTTLLEKIKGTFSQGNDDHLITERLDKMRDLVRIFRDTFSAEEGEKIAVIQTLENLYKDAVAFISNNFEGFLLKAKKSIEDNNFNECILMFNRINFALTHFASHLDKDQLDKDFVTMKSYFMQHLEQTTAHLKSILTKENLSDSDVQLIQNGVNVFTSAEKTEGIQLYIPIENISLVYEGFIKNSIEFFENINLKIAGLIHENKEQAFPISKMLVDDLDKLLTIPEIESKTFEVYYKIIDQIKNFVVTEKNQALKMLDLIIINKKGVKIDFEEFAKHLSNLKNAECFATHSSNLYDNALQAVSVKTMEYVANVQKQVENFDFSLANYNNLEDVYSLVQQLQSLVVCKEIIPEIEALINVTVALFESRVLNALKNVKNNFPINSEDLLSAEISSGQSSDDGNATPDAVVSKKEKPTEKVTRKTKSDISTTTYRDAIAYVNVCNFITLSSVRIEVDLLQTRIHQFINERNEYILTLMNSYFESIINKNSEELTKISTGNEDRTENKVLYANHMVKHLQNMKRLRDFYVNSPLNIEKTTNVDSINAITQPGKTDLYKSLFEDLPRGIIDTWCKPEEGRLCKHIVELFSDLERKLNIEQLHRGMSIVSALSALDNYIIGKQKYGQVVVRYESEIRKLHDDVINEVRMSIQNRRYDELRNQIIKLDPKQPINQDGLKKISADLTKSLDEYRKVVAAKAKALKIEESESHLTGLIDDLIKLHRAKQFVLEYINEPVKSNLNKSLELIEEKICDKVYQFIDGIPAILAKDDFHQVEQALALALKIGDFFDPLYEVKEVEVSSDTPSNKKQETKHDREPAANVKNKLKAKISLDIRKYKAEIQERLNTFISSYSRLCSYIVVNRVPQKETLGSLKIPTDTAYVRVMLATTTAIPEHTRLYPLIESTSYQFQHVESERTGALAFEVNSTAQLYYVSKKDGICIPLSLSPDKLTALDADIKKLDSSGNSSQTLPADYLKLITEKTDHVHIALDISNFPSHPPVELFRKLELAVKDDAIYTEVDKLLKDFIVDEIKAHLEQIMKREPEDSEAQIKEIESIQKYLPVELIGKYETELQKCINQVAESKARNQRELDEIRAAEDFRKLCDTLSGYAYNHHWNNAKKVQNEIDKFVQKRGARFKADIEKGDLITVFDNLPKVWEEWMTYYMVLGEINKFHFYYYGCVIFQPDVVIKTLDATILSLTKKFNHTFNEIKAIKETTVAATISTQFDIVFSFLSLKKDNSNFYQNLIKNDPNVEVKVINALGHVVTWFSTRQAILENALANQDIPELKKAMDASKEANNVFVKVQEYVSLSGDSALEVKTFLSSCKSYKEMKDKFANEILNWKELIASHVLINHKTKTLNAKDRDDFYTTLNLTFNTMKQAKLLADHIESSIVDVNVVEKESIDHLIKELNKIAEHIDSLVQLFPTTDANLYQEFNIWYDNLRSCNECFEESGIVEHAKLKMSAIDKQMDKIVKQLRDSAWKETEISNIIGWLIKLKTITIHIPTYKKKIDETIDDLLNSYKKKPDGTQIIGKLGLELDSCKDDTAITQMLIAEHTSFKGYSLYLRNEKTLRFTVDEVVDGLKGDALNKSMLLDEYKAFDEEYWSLVQEGLAKRDKREEYARTLINNTLIQADNETNGPKKIRSLMAHVFAFWTLENSQHYLDVAGTVSNDPDNTHDEKRKHYLLQPHAAQVISIFRLFGFDKSKDDNAKLLPALLSSTVSFFKGEDTSKNNHPYLVNHLVQILTGEGKSVTLAVTAVVLALMGFDVGCPCYSEYLSSRDYEAFSSIFSAFTLDKYIRYGTFNQLCEDFINERGDIRTLVETTIKSGSKVANVAAPSKRPKILLIDEADVFFNKDFYGNLYRPMANLADPTITDLIDYIWKNRSNPNALFFSNIKKTKEYQKCCTAFSSWEFLIEESVKNILSDIKTFESHDYVVQYDQIGYKDQDGISFNITYGYNTLFAYYKENAAGKISHARLDSKKCLLIDCGSFSYAEVPKQCKYIMGVTGTLETLSAPQRRLLNEVYNIKKFTYTPSVYGANQLLFAGDSAEGVKIEASVEAYYIAIKKEIEQKLLFQKRVERAVLVFFESTPKLLNFYRSNVMKPLASVVKIMTEEVSPTDKEGLIRQAVTPGSITLLTREFGRGTDFICYDEGLVFAGGVHVIQTFLSEELSEETQIKGRTARQGNVGSFSMVLLEKELEKFGITPALIAQMKSTNSIYTTLNEKRNAFFDKQYPENMRYVDDIKKEHQEALNFLQALISKDMKAIKEFLAIRNKAPFSNNTNSVSKTICLMDATGSMSSLIQKSKNTVATMFERAYEILKESGMEAVIEIQFVVYRNYNCLEDKLLQASPWETKPESLRVFMDKIGPEGGLGNEAIEIGLNYVNNESDKFDNDNGIAQVILIGDMPPNSESEVREKREHNQGEAYWRATKFAVPTYYKREVQKLAEKGIPVHTFYVADAARGAFQEIASMTKGQTNALDINSDKGAELLTNLVTERILDASAGGGIVGQKLVEAYREKYVKGYIAKEASKKPNPANVSSNVVRSPQPVSDMVSRVDEDTSDENSFDEDYAADLNQNRKLGLWK